MFLDDIFLPFLFLLLDIISIMNVYTAKINGLRKYKKPMEEEIKKVITTGIVLNLYVYGNNVYPQSTAIDAMNNLYFVTYDYSTGQQQINSITPEGIVISYGKFTGNELYNDRKGNIYFDDNMNHKIMGTKSLQLIPVLSDFNGINKNYFDGSFQIVAPSTDSMGTFTFESSNTAVATISGTTVSIVGPGITTIIATQSSDATHVTNSISANLTVSNVSVLTKNGQISVTDFNYVNKNGAVGTASGVNSNGESKITKTN